MKIDLRIEESKDYYVVEKLTRDAFWNVYKPGCDEHLMVHQLRKEKDFIPELDFVAECEGKLVGNVLCSKVAVVNDELHITNTEDVIAIGPIGVLPEWQSKGVGSMMMEKVKVEARKLGYKGIVLYGNPDYYYRFGFVNAKNYSLTTPEGSNFDAFMALELSDNSMDGIEGKCFESKGFEIQPEELAEFEKQFL